MYRVFVEAVFQTTCMLGCSFGVDAGVDTRFGFLAVLPIRASCPASSVICMLRVLIPLRVAISVAAVAGGQTDPVGRPALFVGNRILNAFHMQVTRICLYAFADKLRTFEGGIPAASDGGLSGRAADMGVAVGCFCLIAVATC